MSTKDQLRRFENKAQLLRYISDERETDLDTLWNTSKVRVEQRQLAD